MINFQNNKYIAICILTMIFSSDLFFTLSNAFSEDPVQGIIRKSEAHQRNGDPLLYLDTIYSSIYKQEKLLMA